MAELTRRELVATMLMQGMFREWEATRLYDFETMASDARDAADALLKKLTEPADA